MTHESIREKITTILNSEDTTTFLNNVTKPLGNKTRKPIIMRCQSPINSFLINVFPEVEDTDKPTTIKNLIINDKKIKVFSMSNKSKFIYFNYFKYREGEEFDIKKEVKKTKEKLNSYKYFLIILINEKKHNSDFKVNYEFYLIPASFFNFDEKIHYKSGKSYRGENWLIVGKKDFRFNVNVNNLKCPIFTYNI